jgi:uncharacterized damage-inducible protein DinB
MKFEFDKLVEILERTPDTLISLLNNLSEEWTSNNEGVDTWSVFDVVGHLIHCEKTDWIVRFQIILSDTGNKNFKPVNRFAQFQESSGKSLDQLLKEFKLLREQNLQTLKSKKLLNNDFDKTGIHPAFGNVTLAQLLSTWAVHDLNHIAQISRIMAKQYKANVGPWIEYLRILKT